MNRRVALLGYPVEHSLSPAMQNAAFSHYGLDWQYSLLPTPEAQFGAQIERCKEAKYAGWNITVPHKARMVRYLDEQRAEVRATGACNTVCVEGDRLIGFNTDQAGFLFGLDEAGGIEAGSRAIVLGAGGAARAVAWALAQAGHSVLLLARNGEQAAFLSQTLRASSGCTIQHCSLDTATLAKALPGASLLVNCTPAGMWPHTEESPLPEETLLPAHLLVYDLIYRPRPTCLLRQAASVGCRTQDGLSMLVNQGAASFEVWTGLPAPRAVMLAALEVVGSR